MSHLKVKNLCKVRVRCSVGDMDDGSTGIIDGGERSCLELLISVLFWK